MTEEQTSTGAFGLGEQELRERLEQELVRAMHVEGDRPTVHAIAHSIARVVHEDHVRMLEQLGRVGVQPREQRSSAESG